MNNNIKCKVGFIKQDELIKGLERRSNRSIWDFITMITGKSFPMFPMQCLDFKALLSLMLYV